MAQSFFTMGVKKSWIFSCLDGKWLPPLARQWAL